MTKKIAAFLLALTAMTSLFGAARADEARFERVVAFATKTGFRVVVSWQADRPVRGEVEWGDSPSSLPNVATPWANLVDTAQIATLEGLDRESVVYFRVVDRETGAATDVQALETVNAYTDWDATDGTYTIDLLVQVDSPTAGHLAARDISLEEVAAGVNVLAERTYDALDGYARIGNVIVTDTVLNHPVNVPARGAACAHPAGIALGGTAADLLVETTVPFDSHTWGGFAINSNCTGMYIGRQGQLVVPWQDDLHMGYVMAHELMHYAFNSPDLYSSTSGDGCANLAWDGSIMHNSGGYSGGRWRLTELDRNQTLTPCDHSGSSSWSWPALRERWTNVPEATAPDNPIQKWRRGNPDGDALSIYILRNLPGGSTLTPFVTNEAH